MVLLFEDREITIAIKPPDLVSEQTDQGDGFADLLATRNLGRYVGVVHRLDRGVGGVMVYAKTPVAAAALSKQIQERSFQKEYLAVVHGEPSVHQDTLRDLLFHDRTKNKTFVVDRVRNGVKEAVLDYEVIATVNHAEYGKITLLRIQLQTGRTHQIRAQFAFRKMPLIGDRKYGSPMRADIALFCTRIAFLHPKTRENLEFCQKPSGGVWDSFVL